ncbi:MAG: hypothetical protein KZQ58_12510 [gamma proteobacterium symbiont of Bathyaustriella thionipta]|nr:hypothetical protein [gamma proteobacterium symbiont of Bathyaustriella thionipta]
MAEPLTSQRLDKWLWAARFFKTRQLAAEAIRGGKVHLNGQRSKPGKEVRPGSKVNIHKSSLQWQIEVVALSKQRRPASEACQFYEESPESLEKRQQVVQQLREERQAAPRVSRRPNKQQRRQIHRFKQQ